jgi:hypothetical protein
MGRFFTWPWILGVAIASCGVILVRLVAAQVTAPYQTGVRLLGYLFSVMGLTMIALGVNRGRPK